MFLMINQVQKLIMLLGLWISLPAFLLLTNPQTLALPLLIVPFLLLASLLYKTAEIAMSVLFKDLTRKRVRTMAVVIALLPTLLLVLASIRQLTVRDTGIVIGLLAVLTFYMRRIDFLKP